MIKAILTSSIIVFLSFASSYAQHEPPKTNTINEKNEKQTTQAKPSYNFHGYLARNLQYPKEVRDNEVQGRILVKFTIEKDGKISNVKIAKGIEIGNGLPEEAIRVIENMPQWIPATENGHPVASEMSQIIQFMFTEEDADYDTDKSQTPPLSYNNNDTSIYNEVNEKAAPTYNFRDYLAKNLKYPPKAIEKKTVGKIELEFIIEKDGSIGDVRIIKGANIKNGLPEEAIRLIKNMPKWKPAMIKGEPVRSYFTFPIQFTLEE